MSKKYWAIKLNPPTEENSASVSVAAAAVPLRDDDSGLTEALAFGENLPLSPHLVLSFRIHSPEAPCIISVMPQGWKNGCGLPLVTHLMDERAKEQERYQIYPAVVPEEVNPCQTLNVCLHGDGLLTLSGRAVSMTTDLTSAFNSEGLYVVVERPDNGQEDVVVTFSRSFAAVVF
jgi:hypothetical protein